MEFKVVKLKMYQIYAMYIHIVTVVSGGEDCLKIYNDKLQDVTLHPDPNEHIQPFDAVVLDYEIPKMN
jgi:hypothetical protein